MSQQPGIIVIAGPTASGKTELAIRVAEKLHTEIISFDSRQIYQELNIGVARPTVEELRRVKHHFIACGTILEPWTAAFYAAQARTCLNEVISRTGTAVLCGGTGLYLQALTDGLDELPAASPEIRSQIDRLRAEAGEHHLAEKLLETDPDAGEFVQLTNPARVQRALEILLQLPGKKLKDVFVKEGRQIDHQLHMFGIDMPRELLYQRINDRVSSMFRQGLTEEVRSLLPYRNSSALRTVGYTELFEYLDGHINLEEAEARIAQHTRNYAKRQMTWFRNKTNLTWLPYNQAEPAIFAALRDHGYIF